MVERRSRTRHVVEAGVLVVAGALVAFPLTAHSKGQWCNDTEDGQRLDLTVESTKVDGVALALPAGGTANAAIHLRTEISGDDVVHAELPDPDGGTRVVHVGVTR